MTRSQLLANFATRVAHPPSAQTEAEGVLLQYLAKWFEHEVADEHPEGILWAVRQYVVEAFDRLMVGTDPFIVDCRQRLLAATNWPRIPHLTWIHHADAMRYEAVTLASSLMAKVMANPYAEHLIEEYLLAEDHVLRQAFLSFMGIAYTRGLRALLAEYPHRSGCFDVIILRSTRVQDRYVLTFAEPRPDGSEYRVTFSGAVEDERGLRFRNETVWAPFLTAVFMIKLVTAAWPATIKKQRLAFQPDEDIHVESR